jgi:hypothetical protein
MNGSIHFPSTPVCGYLYGCSRADGSPIHPPVAWATPVEFTELEVLHWHMSKQRGDSRWFLGADLSDGRQVWLIRSHQSPVMSKHLNTVADSIQRNRKGFRGSPQSMLFIYERDQEYLAEVQS